MSPPRLSVIGCGSIGKRHISNLTKLGAEVVVASDLDANRREAVAAELGIDVVEKPEEALAREADAALVCVPTVHHASLARMVADRGLHLFIEKPLAASTEGLDDLLQTVESKGLKALVGCNMRFHPGPRWMKSEIDSGAIGKVLGAHLEFGYHLPLWHPDEDYRTGYSARRDLGGGVILDAIHEIDLIRWLVGDVSSVTCIADKVSSLDIETEDLANIVLRFTSGAIGSVHLDYLQHNYRRGGRAVGENGTLEWDWDLGTRSFRDGGWSEWTAPQGFDVNQMYLDEMQHFLACVLGEEEPVQDLIAGRSALDIALAAKESARTGQRIDLDG